MKKSRRILAMIGVIIILFFYICTIVLAIFGNDKTQDLLRISLYATVVVPVLIWAYTFIGRLLEKYYSGDRKDPEEKKAGKAAETDGKTTEKDTRAADENGPAV